MSSTPQKATKIDGKAIAEQIRKEIAVEVAKLKETVGKAPGLAVVLVGTRKDSETYVRSKKRACEEVGITSFGITLPEDATQEEVVGHVKQFNDDPAVHGILVQLPLPKVLPTCLLSSGIIFGQPQAQVLHLAQLLYKVWLGVVEMVVVYFLWFYTVCIYYVAPGERFKTKAWKRRITLRQTDHYNP